MKNNFKVLVDRKNVKLQQIADRTGIQRSTLSEIYNGHKGLCITHIEPLCNYFHTTPNYLLGYEDKEKDKQLCQASVNYEALYNKASIRIHELINETIELKEAIVNLVKQINKIKECL